MSVPTLPSFPLDDKGPVLIWRENQFQALGFNETEAKLLAASPEADLTRARTLIKAGCPSHVAFRILA
jgi:hypothetical protein